MNPVRIALVAAVLVIAARMASAQEALSPARWYLQSFQVDGTTHLASEAQNETLIVTVKNGKTMIANARSGLPLEMRLAEQHGNASFYTAGPADNTDKYRITFSGDKMTLVTDTSHMEFGLHQGALAPLAPVPAPNGQPGGPIILKDEWARRDWFGGFERDFARRYDRRFVACFSDATCLRTCDDTDACEDELPQTLLNMLVGSNARDPLFVDNDAGNKLANLVVSRKLLLDLGARLHRRKATMQLAYMTQTLEILRQLTVNGTPQVANPADTDRYFNQVLESTGCTVAGFVPVLGNLLSLSCGIRSLSTVQPPQISPSQNTTSIADLFKNLVQKQNEYADKVYFQFDSRIASALKDEADVLSLYDKIIAMQSSIRQPTTDEITDSIFDAVWPYSFFLLVKSGPIAAKPVAPATCADQLSVILTSVSPRPPGLWAVSLHPALSGSDFYYNKHSSDDFIPFTWTLNIGTIGASNQVGKEARTSFDGYLRRHPNISILVGLWDSHRIYAETPYGVTKKILLHVNIVEDNFVEYDPQNPGVMVWPPSNEWIKQDALGAIRDSISGRAGRLAMPPVKCLKN